MVILTETTHKKCCYRYKNKCIFKQNNPENERLQKCKSQKQEDRTYLM